MNTAAMFTSNSEEWETPQDLYDELDREFHFTVDLCATDKNAKCERFYTKHDDGLAQSWVGEVAWCNPPYGRQIGSWVKRAYMASRVGCAIVVMLIPSRTDTQWFHEFIYRNTNAEVRFVKGRIKFVGAKHGAPFPSMIVVFRPECNNE